MENAIPREPRTSDESPRDSKRLKMSKLRGFDFFRSIGSPKRVVAPMVDQSELAFRMLTRHHGAELCYTPMFHSRLFSESPEYRAKMFEKHIKDRPLVVQFCGNDPQTVLAAARHVEAHCDAVDLNLGCPQGIARKGRYGSFLMKEKDVVRSIVSTLSENLSIPVTVKIRVFPDRQETLEFCDMLQAAGCDLLVVHGRTKEMNKTAVREVDWDIIREIKQRLTIPVLANGGIEVPEDVERCLEATKCDGVMSSEAILENPAIFGSERPSFMEMAKQYLDFAREYPPASEKIIKAHLFKILFQDLRVHTDLRTELAKSPNREDMARIVAELDARLASDEFPPVVYSAETSWYRRHRKGQEKVQQQQQQQQEKPEADENDSTSAVVA
ncbi:hypothetical protein ATCC90586_008751 [Pythium insidiosum]|nr:hypothetical protein ATCC90586_008751 [Pythium insidiosum]